VFFDEILGSNLDLDVFQRNIDKLDPYQGLLHPVMEIYD
jgi:hypothetical protein